MGDKRKMDEIQECVWIISFISTVGSWISVWVGNIKLTAMLGLFTVSMLWLYQLLDVRGKRKK